MAERRRCELGAPSKSARKKLHHDSPVCRATRQPGSVPAGHRRAEEGHGSPTAEGRTREKSPTASRYHLRNTQARACRRDKSSGPGVRVASLPSRASATNTGSRRDVARKATNGDEGDSNPPRAGKKPRREQGPDDRPTLQQRRQRRAVPSRILSTRQAERLGTWNVRSLQGLGKLEQLAGEMERYRLAVLAVTETHLPGEGEKLLDVNKGYRLVFSGRTDGRKAEGVGLAFSPYAWNALRCYEAVSPRILTAEVLTRIGPLAIIVGYAPTNQASEEVKEQFYADLDGVMTKTNGLTMLLGDFNASLGDSVPGVVGPHGLGKGTSDNGERLVEFASAHQMCITNTLFPHKTIHQATWYPPDARAKPSLKDYVLVKRRLRPSVMDTRVFRGADLDTDHRLVVVTLRLKLDKKSNQRKGKRFETALLGKTDRRMAYVEALRESFDKRRQQGSVEERWSELKEALVGSAEQHLKRRRMAKKKWISDDTLELVETKRMAFRRWQEHRTDKKKQKEYQAMCKKVRQALKGDKEKWLENEITEMEEDIRHHKHGNFFKRMRKLTNSSILPTNTILDEEGQTLKRPEEKLARWQRHFEKVLNVRNEVAEEVVSELENRSHGETPEVTREEVKKAVWKLRNGKAAGQDEVEAELLKKGGEAAIDWLTEVVQQVWKSGKVPQEWKDATLIPVHKKRARNDCDNYRGIALLSIPGKVLALILLERMQVIVEPQLMEAQCGFRKGRSTADQIWLTRQVVEKATEYHTSVYFCFVDLIKAYDSVDRAALIAVLRSYGVPNQLVNLVGELYTETKCCVRTAEGTSEAFEVKTGVRQGCILSPLLFNCFLDRIVKGAMSVLGGGVHMEYSTEGGLFLSYRDKTPASAHIQDARYADDMALIAESRNELQHMLTVLDEACERWGMRISVEKTKVLAVGEQQDPAELSSILLQDQALEEVESFPYLGSEVGQSARVEKEVTVRVNKASTVYQMLRRKVFRSRYLSKSTKLRVFRMMVMSTLLYGAETWPVTQKDIRRLTTFQMRCLRDILGLTLWDRRRNVDVLEECGETTVRDQLRLKRLQWLGHVLRMPIHRPQRQIIKSRPRGRRRPPGGTPLRWVDVVNQDLASLPNWQAVVKDRARWRAFIHQPLEDHRNMSS